MRKSRIESPCVSLCLVEVSNSNLVFVVERPDLHTVLK